MTPVCLVCSSSTVKETFSIPDNEYGLSYRATYVDCGGCGCFYQFPMPDDAQLASFYPTVYHSMHSKSLIARMKNSLRLKKLKSILPPGGTFMDFGCGNGSFILYASEQCPDRKFYGYEIDGKDSTTSLNDGKVVIFKGSLDYLKKNMPVCNVISMHHVIEHLPEPKPLIKYMHQNLAPGGFITGQTPATDSFERKLFKQRWSGFHAPRHTVVFSRKGLAELMKLCGFETVQVKTGFNPAAYAVSLATLFHGKNGGIIRRAGLKWLFFVGLATLLTPIDRILGGSIIDFYAAKNS